MITIGLDPNIIALGPFLFSWHGFFTFVAVAVAVMWVAHWAPKVLVGHPTFSSDKATAEEEIKDMVYATAIWGILSGVIGARLVHVIDQWSEIYAQNPGQIIAVWQGGIALWGGILGGLAGASLYAYIRKFPVTKLMDLTAPALLLAQAIGRVGDIINGEHVSRATDMVWGVVWSHPKSPTYQAYGETPTHPAVGYELIWDLLGLWFIWYVLRGKVKPDGMLFVLYIGIYAFGRFFISFFREDKVWFLGLQQSQLISILVLAIVIPVIAYGIKFVDKSSNGDDA